MFFFVAYVCLSFCRSRKTITVTVVKHIQNKHAIKFARWQHPAVGRGTCFDVACIIFFVFGPCVDSIQ